MSIATAIVTWRAILMVATDKTPRLIWITSILTASVMLSAPVLRASTAIEPFALNNLMAALLMLLAASEIVRRRGPNDTHASAGRALMPCFMTGILFGLAFCNHHSMAFAFPIAIALIPEKTTLTPRNASRFIKITARRTLLATGGFLIGCLPMAWFLFERNSVNGPVWGDWTQFWPQLLRHLLRTGYGTFQLTAVATGYVWSGPWFMLKSFAGNLGLLLPLACVGCVSLIRSRSRSQTKNHLAFQLILVTTVCFLNSGLVMSLLFRQDQTSEAMEIMSRFVALPLLFLTPFLSLSIARLIDQQGLQETLQGIRKFDTTVISALLMGIAMLIIPVVAPLPYGPRSRSQEIITNAHLDAAMLAANARPEGSLESDTKLPPIVVTTSDLDFFGMNYKNARRMVGLQPAILIQSGLWTTPWHRKKALSALEHAGFNISPEVAVALHRSQDSNQLFQVLIDLLKDLSRVTPVNLASGTFPGIEELEANSFPLGPFIRVAGAEAHLPPHTIVIRMNEDLSKIIAEKIGTRRPSTAWESHALDGWRRSRIALGLPADPTGQ
jgi:hypothetical protein